MMGAGNVKRVYTRWGDLQGPAFRLLAYIAVTVLDRDDRPRCELSRESLAAGLGYEHLDLKADRAVTRALSSLTVAGALTRAQRAAPGQRAHYWLELSMEHLPPGVQRSSDDSQSNVGQSVSEHLPPNVQRSSDDTVLPLSGEVPGEELTAAATPPPPHLRAIPGGNGMPRTTKPQQPGLWPSPVPDTPGDALSVTGGSVLKDWIDYCQTERDVKLPRRLIGQYAKLIKEALDDGFPPNQVKTALASMLADNVANRPSLLPNRLVEVQTGPERRARRAPVDHMAQAEAVADRLQPLQLDRKALGA